MMSASASSSRIDEGKYAPTGFVDTDGRCIGLWNIMECTIKDNMLGHKGEMVSLPRQLTANQMVTADAGWNIRPINPLGIEGEGQLGGGFRVRNRC